MRGVACLCSLCSCIFHPEVMVSDHPPKVRGNDTNLYILLVLKRVWLWGDDRDDFLGGPTLIPDW